MKLKFPREGHNCALIPGTKDIMVVGDTNSTECEIISTNLGKVSSIKAQLNTPSVGHGIGLLNIDNRPSLAIFGGLMNIPESERVFDLFDDVEAFCESDTDRGQWKTTSIKLNQPMEEFAYLNLESRQT